MLVNWAIIILRHHLGLIVFLSGNRSIGYQLLYLLLLWAVVLVVIILCSCCLSSINWHIRMFLTRLRLRWLFVIHKTGVRRVKFIIEDWCCEVVFSKVLTLWELGSIFQIILGVLIFIHLCHEGRVIRKLSHFVVVTHVLHTCLLPLTRIQSSTDRHVCPLLPSFVFFLF